MRGGGLTFLRIAALGGASVCALDASRIRIRRL